MQQETARRMQETDQLIKRQARAADRRMDKLDELFTGALRMTSTPGGSAVEGGRSES